MSNSHPIQGHHENNGPHEHPVPPQGVPPRRAGAGLVAVLAAFLFLALFLPALANGQEPDQDGPSLSVGYGFVARAEFDESTAKVGASTLSLEAGFDWLSLEYDRTTYSWTGKEDLSFGNRSDDPWKTLHVLTLASEHDGMFNRDWGWIAGLEVEAAFEEEMSGSLGVGGYGAGVYMVSDQTMVTFGLALSGHETGFDFLPLLMVGWDNVDQTGSGWYGALGIPQTMVGYSFSRAFSLTLELDSEETAYRLADDSTVSRKGYVGHEEMGIGLAAAWTPLEHVSLTLTPGYRFGRSMTIYDDNGDKMDSHDLDSSWGAAFDLSIRF